jgi:hypothetical protein
VAYPDEHSAPPEDQGFRLALIIIGFMLVMAVLFTLYHLVGDGGGNMS